MSRQDVDEILIAVTVVIVLLTSAYSAAKSCDGTLVRGVFWYECVGGEG